MHASGKLSPSLLGAAIVAKPPQGQITGAITRCLSRHNPHKDARGDGFRAEGWIDSALENFSENEQHEMRTCEVIKAGTPLGRGRGRPCAASYSSCKVHARRFLAIK